MPNIESVRTNLECLGFDLSYAREIDVPSAEDLTRLSIQRMITSIEGTARVVQSSGAIHLCGPGVNGHAASASMVGKVLVHLQSAIDAIGCVIDGHPIGESGPLPAAILSQTKMNITSSPQPGSLMLNLSPVANAFEAVFPEGETLYGYESFGVRPLADIAMDELIRIINCIDAESPNQDEFVELMVTMGSRVANSVKKLMLDFDDGGFDAELIWREPLRNTIAATVDHDAARYVAEVIKNSNIDTRERIFEGTLITSTSSPKDKLRIKINESGEEVLVSLGIISPSSVQRFRVGEDIQIQVEESIGRYIGGKEVVKYRGLSIDSL